MDQENRLTQDVINICNFNSNILRLGHTVQIVHDTKSHLYMKCIWFHATVWVNTFANFCRYHCKYFISSWNEFQTYKTDKTHLKTIVSNWYFIASHLKFFDKRDSLILNRDHYWRQSFSDRWQCLPLFWFITVARSWRSTKD